MNISGYNAAMMGQCHEQFKFLDLIPDILTPLAPSMIAS
jgi:hypothetical protein